VRCIISCRDNLNLRDSHDLQAFGIFVLLQVARVARGHTPSSWALEWLTHEGCRHRIDRSSRLLGRGRGDSDGDRLGSSLGDRRRGCLGRRAGLSSADDAGLGDESGLVNLGRRRAASEPRFSQSQIVSAVPELTKLPSWSS